MQNCDIELHAWNINRVLAYHFNKGNLSYVDVFVQIFRVPSNTGSSCFCSHSHSRFCMDICFSHCRGGKLGFFWSASFSSISELQAYNKNKRAVIICRLHTLFGFFVCSFRSYHSHILHLMNLDGVWLSLEFIIMCFFIRFLFKLISLEI